MNGRRLLLRTAVVAGVVGAALIAPRLTIQALPAPPAASSFALSFQEAGSDTWETPPIEAAATIAGLSWEGDPPRRAWVRASKDGSEWSPWTELQVDSEHGPDPGTAEAAASRPASEPVYVGEANWLQYRVEGAEPGRVKAEVVETAGRQLGVLERAALVVRGIELTSAVEAGASPTAPEFISRDEWGADSCQPSNPSSPEYITRVRVMFVHHTATANGYTEAEAPEVIRSVCAYHVFTLGWSDIAYNFLIDRFGNTYEGRAGGVSQAVYGGHTKGFNSYSSGVALIGDHTSAAPGPDAIESLEHLLAWKLDLNHADPTGSSKVMSLGSTLYPFGDWVTLPNIAGHRDAQATSCPGDSCYVLLPSIRKAVEKRGGAKIYGGFPDVEPTPYRQDMVFHLGFTERMAWSFRLSHNVDGSTMVSRSGTGKAATITWDRIHQGAYVEPGWYPVELTAETSDGGTPRQASTAVLVFRPPFVDDDGSIHEFSIQDIAEAGITVGCGGNRYCPNQAVTRGQMASFLTRALDLPPSPDDWFDDDDKSVHDEAIDSIAEAGITKGFPNGTFRPDQAVTRGQMASFLTRALDLPPSPDDWFDDDDNSVHDEAIDSIAEAGITTGFSDGTFRPEEPVTRAQMASFLDRGFLE